VELPASDAPALVAAREAGASFPETFPELEQERTVAAMEIIVGMMTPLKSLETVLRLFLFIGTT